MSGANVLIVEDDPFEAQRMQLELTRAGFHVVAVVDSGLDFLETLRTKPIDIAIVDILLSGEMDGIDAVSDSREFSDVPVIFVTGFDNEDFITRAEKVQPAAYLLKPYRKRELYFLLKMALTRHKIEVELKQAREEAELALWQMATHDPLTRLPNRTLLIDRLEQMIAKSHRGNGQIAVLFIDMDNFKVINDSMGHSVGDKVLRRVADRLSQGMRGGDTVARLGGDEFVVLSELNGNLPAEESAISIATKLGSMIGRKTQVEGKEVQLSTSCGIAVYPGSGNDARTMLRNADTAMYWAKQQSGHSYRLYSEDLTQMAHKHLELETSLVQALDNNEFEVFYQPQFDMQTGRVQGAEALLRWNRPGHGLVMPDIFIPHAEETGLITPITRWVMSQSCRQMRRWLDDGLPIRYVAVNVSGTSALDTHIEQIVEQALQQADLPAEFLELEITESHLLEKIDVVTWLRRLNEMGVRLAIDDFGTGYSSLSYLKQLPLSKIKIDRSFLQDVPGDQSNVAIVRAIITLGNSLGMVTTAEGVETHDQLGFVRNESCSQVQGFLTGRPLDSDQMAEMLRRADDGADGPLH